MNLNAIQDLGRKLGVTNGKLLKKALEFSRLLDVRASSTSLAALRLTGSCKTVMCLDLASSLSGQKIDREHAIKLSGVNKKTYNNTLKAVESMLDLQDNLSIKDLSVQFGCTPAVSLATQTLQSYEGEQCCDIDFNSLLFQAAALSAACKKLKLKVDKGKLKEVCSVKRTTYDRLVVELEKHAEKLLGKKKDIKRTKPKTFLEEVEEKLQESDATLPKHRKTDSDEEAEGNVKVNYEEWKKRLLATAAKAGSS